MDGKLGWVLFVMLSVSGIASAQDSRKLLGYAFFAPGGTSGDFSHTTLHFGGGGEYVSGNGLGGGAEIGYLARTDRGNDGFGLFSVNASYHFGRAKLVPFVTGGGSIAFRRGSSGGANFGGGIHYWAKDEFALRLEFRNHILSSDTPYFYGFRIGAAFR